MQASQSIVSPRLEKYRIFQTHDLDEAHGFLASKNFRVNFPSGDRAALDLHINGVYLPGMYLGHFCYGRAAVLRATPARTDYWLQMPTQRKFSIEIGSRNFECDDRRAVLLSPIHENVIRSEQGCGRLGVSLTRDALVKQLSAMLDRPLDDAIVFSPEMDVGSGYGHSLARYLRTAVDDFEQDDSLLRNPLAMSAFEQFVITGLLLSHRHNYSEQLHAPVKSIAPRDVRRAVDFIEANLQAPITLADIARAAGVSGRALFNHFREFKQSSPMGYLREARFRAVRNELQHAPTRERIADIAARWGFDHIGRFATEYRRRFGEKPSETKRRTITSN